MRNAASAALLGLLLGGCHSAGDTASQDAGLESTAPAPPNAAAVQRACRDQAHERCARLQTCAPGRVTRTYGDEPACESRTSAACAAALVAPGTGDTPDTVEACAGAYAGWACKDLLDDVAVPAACAPRTGKQSGNKACAFDGQCTTGFCAFPTNSSCGVCAPLPVGGTPCGGSETCGPGLVCAGDLGDAKKCAALVGAGASCGGDAPCGAGLFCVADPERHEPGRCEAAVAQAGATCDPTGTVSAGCDADLGLSCDPRSKQCVPIVFAGAGQPCDTDALGAPTARCAASGACTGAMAERQGACIAAAADRTPCNAQLGPGCLPPAVCLSLGDGGSGLCQMPVAACP
jgi:hypothetical protein